MRSYDTPTREQHHETALLAAVARFSSEDQRLMTIPVKIRPGHQAVRHAHGRLFTYVPEQISRFFPFSLRARDIYFLMRFIHLRSSFRSCLAIGEVNACLVALANREHTHAGLFIATHVTIPTKHDNVHVQNQITAQKPER